MTSDRMMQVIGRMERAISRLETALDRTLVQTRDQAQEIQRLKVERMELIDARTSAPEPDPHSINPHSHEKALAALRSLDSLIDDLQKARGDG